MGSLPTRVIRGLSAFALLRRDLRPWLLTTAPLGLFWLILVTAMISQVHALGEFIPAGARSAGMGDAYVGLAAGGEGVFWNPGSVVTGSRFSAMVGYDRPFGLSELDTVSGASALRIGRVGIGVQYQGMQASALMETTSGLALGLRVNAVGTGLRFRSGLAQVSGRAPRQWVVAGLGVLIVSSTGIQVGLVGHNVTGKKVSVLG